MAQPKATAPQLSTLPNDVSSLCLDPARRLFLDRVGRFFMPAAPGPVPSAECQICGRTIDVGVASTVDGLRSTSCAAQQSITMRRPGVTPPKEKLDKDGNPAKPKIRKDGSPAIVRVHNCFGRRTGAFVDANRAIVIGNVAPVAPLPKNVVHLTNGTNESFKVLYEAAFMADYEPDALFVEFGLKQSVPMVLTAGRSVVMACGEGSPVPVDVATVRDVVGLMRSYGPEKVADFAKSRRDANAPRLSDDKRREAHLRFATHQADMPDFKKWRVALPSPDVPEMRYAAVICGA